MRSPLFPRSPGDAHVICQHISTIEDSAERGCELCALIVAGFSDHGIERMRLATEPGVEMRYGSGGRHNKIAIVCRDRAYREEECKICIITTAEVDNGLGSAQPTNSRQSLDLATRWFRACDKSHPACAIDDTKTYPRRLLSLSSGVLHLVLSSKMSGRPRYATLSHCWGTIELLKLQKKNHDSFLEKIDENELCKTFKDTIHIARHIGLEYLWIDSLCIIQDDPEDWIRESANMCDVYGGSSINIAASSARNGSFGCFFDRNEKTLRRIQKIRVPVSTGDKIIVYDCAPDDIYRTVDDGPLTQRAWAFQERFLAPRTLHFTDSQLFWECGTMHACETFPAKLPEDYWWEYKMPKIALLSHNRENSVISPDEKAPSESKISMERLLVPNHSLLSLWGYIVDSYSKAKLTKATDKLVALSGVAKWFQSRNGDMYLAGMWRRGLEAALCWECRQGTGDNDSPTRPAEYLAPSWSWASINREVIFHRKSGLYVPSTGDTYRANIEVLGADVKPETIEAPLGRVLYGALYLEFNEMRSQMLIPNEIDALKKISVNLDYPIAKPTLAYFLPAYSVCDEDGNFCCIRGLVLESVEPNGKVFRRLGYFMFFSCVIAEFGSEIDGYSRFMETTKHGRTLCTLTII
ncbi:heterokaryon incompatibility protein-domain-containing protein [Xylaria cf. heliscus]|nr:heterokaryon incompatibility protein-domain-containing protein [Xylaria cf. heliscus]